MMDCGRIHHLVCGFDPARGGQAVHELAVGGRLLEQFHVHLVVWHERGAAFWDLVFLAHPPPQIGVEEVGVLDRGDHVFGDGQRAAGLVAVSSAMARHSAGG